MHTGAATERGLMRVRHQTEPANVNTDVEMVLDTCQRARCRAFRRWHLAGPVACLQPLRYAVLACWREVVVDGLRHSVTVS